MHNIFKAIAIAAAALVAPVAASAATVLADGGSYSIGTAENYFYGHTDAGAGGAGDFTVTFTADPVPLDADFAASLTIGNLGLWNDLTVTWLDENNNVVSTTAVGLDTVLATTFTAPDQDTQTLVISWSGSAAGAAFDIEVSSVPLPAAGGLLLLALGGLAATRRRRKAETA